MFIATENGIYIYICYTCFFAITTCNCKIIVLPLNVLFIVILLTGTYYIQHNIGIMHTHLCA